MDDSAGNESDHHQYLRPCNQRISEMAARGGEVFDVGGDPRCPRHWNWILRCPSRMHIWGRLPMAVPSEVHDAASFEFYLLAQIAAAADETERALEMDPLNATCRSGEFRQTPGPAFQTRREKMQTCAARYPSLALSMSDSGAPSAGRALAQIEAPGQPSRARWSGLRTGVYALTR